MKLSLYTDNTAKRLAYLSVLKSLVGKLSYLVCRLTDAFCCFFIIYFFLILYFFCFKVSSKSLQVDDEH